MTTCREAVYEVFADESGVLTTDQVIERLHGLYPEDPWKTSTIRAHLIGLSVNHPSSPHYPYLRQQHAFLFSLGNGRYRKHDSDNDGDWIVTDDGVRLVEDESEELDNTGTGVSLERDLENWLLTHLDALQDGFQLYRDDGITGHQLPAGDAGRLDILAKDDHGTYIVVELKAGTADDRALGQLLGYMGWVQQELAEETSVRGILVAQSFSERVKYGADAAGILLKAYHVIFQFEEV